MIKIIDTKENSAKKNMQIDLELLNNLKDKSILHFYEFEKKSFTFGHFINIEKYINLNILNDFDIDFAKRPTGGGIVFHIWDIAFSFLMPRNHKSFFLDPLKNYEFVNNLTLNAIDEFLNKSFFLKEEIKNKNTILDNFCMAKPTKFDLIYKNKKILGAAQRRKKNGYLHQASICLVKPDIELLNKIIKEKEVVEGILNSSFAIFNNQNINENREKVKKNILNSFKNL
ncbi:MAG: Octanoyltransferase LipM [Candidatus Anoxychlamydiales bacterium]|nr:Octanoyltransferase LipM [Candidatus Anoxychlamydiales bacterium]